MSLSWCALDRKDGCTTQQYFNLPIEGMANVMDLDDKPLHEQVQRLLYRLAVHVKVQGDQ